MSIESKDELTRRLSGRLAGKVAIVTGSAQGVGLGIATALTRAGARCVVADFNEEAGEQAAKDLSTIGPGASFVRCDVTKRNDVDATVAHAIDAHGQLDILVNNAQRAPFELPTIMEHTDEIIDLCFDTGYRASFHFMQAAHDELAKTGGCVINIGSAAGLDGQYGQAAYGANKEAIRALSKTAAREWGPEGIRVNIICPLAKSPGVVQLLEHDPGFEARVTKGQPIPRLGECEDDIGPVAVFLASDDARYITGHTVPADGGACMIR